jgi:ATP-binding cassette subfamily B protein
MMAMGWSVDIIKRGNASINRLNKIFKVLPRIEKIENQVDSPVSGSISVNDLSFSFNGIPVLENISLEIPKGSSLGITGTTGSGKTTLMSLLMKFYETEDNHIFFDGTDINRIPRSRIQEAVVYVPQDTTIFSGTVTDNITFMNPDLTEHQIVEAAKISAIYEDIVQFPNGFNTIVGERGLSLSGGQRQRIAIARAMLLKPRVLILDDVLSSLDLQTESVVFKNIINEMRGNTLISVSSRVPSISGFDNIAVFEDGKIVEFGNHNELKDIEGIYSHMYRMQTI